MTMASLSSSPTPRSPGSRPCRAAEQDLALEQAVCPVSGEHLGKMGMPFKTAAGGRTFYLCCKNCEDDVKADPKAVIAKLDKK